MSAAGLSITGADRIKARLQRSQTAGRDAIHAATKEAIAFLMEKSQAILDAEVYDKSRSPFEEAPDKEDPESLYRHFKKLLSEISSTASEGRLANDSAHALFLEDGTDDEGTGKHFIPIGAKGFLAWMDGNTGEIVFDKKGHEVKGIKPIRFLSRALSEHRDEVLEIYRRHFSGIFS